MKVFELPPFSLITVLLVLVIGYSSPLSLAGTTHNHRSGMFVGAGDHNAEGSVELKGHSLTLSNIVVDKVPDGRVYLTKDAVYDSGIELGKLEKFSGTVNFSIPKDVNPDDYNSVLIWCKKFSVEIGHALFKSE